MKEGGKVMKKEIFKILILRFKNKLKAFYYPFISSRVAHTPTPHPKISLILLFIATAYATPT